jgi:acyl-CoA reductase-like NAD-dependent aldehyde dehydrogenase
MSTAENDDVMAAVRALHRAREWRRRQGMPAEQMMRIVTRYRIATLRQALAELTALEQLRAFCIRIHRRSPRP